MEKTDKGQEVRSFVAKLEGSVKRVEYVSQQFASDGYNVQRAINEATLLTHDSEYADLYDSSGTTVVSVEMIYNPIVVGKLIKGWIKIRVSTKNLKEWIRRFLLAERYSYLCDYYVVEFFSFETEETETYEETIKQETRKKRKR